MPLLKVLRMCCCQNTNAVSVQEDRMTELQGDEKVWQHVQVSPSALSPFNGQFPGEPGLAGVYWSKGWWRWWWQLDYWNYKSWKAPVKSSPPTNQHAMFYRLDALPVTQPTVSKHWKEKYHIPWTKLDLLTPSSPGGLPTLSLTTSSSWLPWGELPIAMPLISQ